jgi:hypothetical protein
MPTVWLVAYGAGPISHEYVISRLDLHRETAPVLRKAPA